MSVAERQRARDRAFYLKVRSDPHRWARRKEQVNRTRREWRARKRRLAA
jgi:hypothetical protein